MTDNARHFTGVGLFCAGSLTYSIAFLRAARKDERAEAWVRDGLEWCLLGAVVVLVVAFVGLWAQEESQGLHGTDRVQNAYIVEHAAYVAHLLFYAVFFYYHTPDPDKSVKFSSSAEYHHEEHEDGVAMVCRPLLMPYSSERLPVIFETVSVQQTV